MTQKKDDRVHKIVDVAASYRPSIMLFNSRDEDLLGKLFTKSGELKLPELKLRAIQEIEDEQFNRAVERQEIKSPAKTPKNLKG